MVAIKNVQLISFQKISFQDDDALQKFSREVSNQIVFGLRNSVLIGMDLIESLLRFSYLLVEIELFSTLEWLFIPSAINE